MKAAIEFDKKGQVTFGSLASIVIVVGIAAVVAVVMAILLVNIRDTSTTTNSAAFNVSQDSLSFLDNLSGQWGLLGTVVGLVLVVSVVLAVFRFRGSAGGGI